jgi:hypothetical protein
MRGSPLLLCGLVLAGALAAAPEPTKIPPLPALLPKPLTAKPMNDRFRLTERTRVVALDASLLDEATLLAGELSRNLSWKIPAESSQRVNPGDIVLGFDASLKPEAYRLRVTGTRALLAGGTKAGVFRGTRTLLQLFPLELLATAKPAALAEWSAACVEIEDQPTMRWRILDVDAGFFHKPKELLLRDLDQMAQHKINVLRWLLNAEGNWRLPIDKHPEFAAAIKGAPRSYEEERPTLRGDEFALYQAGRPHGGTYTEDEIKEVIAYAQARHIEVIPRVRVDFALEPEDRALQGDVLDTLARLFPGDFIQVDVVDHPNLAAKLAGPGFKKVMVDESLAGAEAARVWLQGELVKAAATRKKRLITRLWGTNAEEILKPGTPKGAIVDLPTPERGAPEATTKALGELIKLGHGVIVSNLVDDQGALRLNLAEGEREPLLLGLATGSGSSAPELDDARQFPAALTLAEAGWSGPKGLSHEEFEGRRRAIEPRVFAQGFRSRAIPPATLFSLEFNRLPRESNGTLAFALTEGARTGPAILVANAEAGIRQVELLADDRVVSRRPTSARADGRGAVTFWRLQVPERATNLKVRVTFDRKDAVETEGSLAFTFLQGRLLDEYAVVERPEAPVAIWDVAATNDRHVRLSLDGLLKEPGDYLVEIRPTKGWAKVSKVTLKDVTEGTLQTFADEGLLQRLRADVASRATHGVLEIDLTTESTDDAGEVWLRRR